MRRHRIVDVETGEIYMRFITRNMKALKIIAKRMNAVVR